MSFKSSLYILETNSLSGMFCKYFLLGLALSFNFLNNTFQRSIILHLWSFSVMIYAFHIRSKNPIFIVVFIERTSLSPLSFPGTIVEYQLAIYLSDYFWPLYINTYTNITLYYYLYSKFWNIVVYTLQLCSCIPILSFYISTFSYKFYN